MWQRRAPREATLPDDCSHQESAYLDCIDASRKHERPVPGAQRLLSRRKQSPELAPPVLSDKIVAKTVMFLFFD